MAGRHRRRRARTGITTRRVLSGVVPVLAAAGVTVAVVLGGGVLIDGGNGRGVDTLRAQTGSATMVPSVPSILRELPGAGQAADSARDAAAAASARAERDRQAAEEEKKEEADVCDLEGPPRFDDPDHPNWITNRDCGYVDDQGRERSNDPWIDDQLLSSYGE